MPWMRLLFIAFIKQVMMNREGKSMVIYYQTCLLLCMKDVCKAYVFFYQWCLAKNYGTQGNIYSLHINISMHILHTVFYAFPKILTRKICSAIKSFL